MGEHRPWPANAAATVKFPTRRRSLFPPPSRGSSAAPALKPACLGRQEGLGQSASPRASLRAASRGLCTQQNRFGPFLASCPARPSIVAVASLGARARGRLPAASEALALSQRS